MAKTATIKIKLESTAGTGFFYVTKKNSRTMTDKMKVTKYDPVARKHVGAHPVVLPTSSENGFGIPELRTEILAVAVG